MSESPSPPALPPPVAVAELLPPCPSLPAAPALMDWRDIRAHGEGRDGPFYLTMLVYAQYLWRRRIPARAILCLDRALGAELYGDEPELQAWPLPYAAMAWMLRHSPEGVFIGNPRVHFQHYADRMNEPRRDQRQWRAWACWALTRAARPEWPADPRHQVEEPSVDRIADRLTAHGLPGEAAAWRAVLAACAG